MKKFLIQIIFLIIFNPFVCSQTVLINNDSLFIKVSKEIIGKQLLINEFNKFGTVINKNEITNRLIFLFITDSLKNQLLLQNKYTDSLNAERGYLHPGRGNKIPYGMDFKHYNLDFENSKKSLGQYQKSYDFIALPNEGLISNEQLEKWKEEISKWNDTPLGNYFISNSFLEGKNIVNYEGNETSYNLLATKTAKAKKIFLVLPIDNSIFQYDYQLIEIKEIYYQPRI